MDNIIEFGISNILTAFEDDVVGTKVTSGEGDILHTLSNNIRSLSEGAWQNGATVIKMPEEYHRLARCGVAELEGLKRRDLHIKKYRGEWQLFALPRCAVKTDTLSVLVYQIDAYLNDPEVTPAEHEALREAEATHVIVAVWAGPGALSSHRLVRNLAGGNNAFIPATSFDGKDLTIQGRAEISPGELAGDVIKFHEAIAKAKQTVENEKKYIVVADPDPVEDEDEEDY